jgi:hypothetical protein
MSDAPPPSSDAPEVCTGQRIVDIFISASGHSRAIVTIDCHSIYRLYEEFWCTSFWIDEGYAFWSRTWPLHFTDDICSARRDAHVHIRETPNEDVEPLGAANGG